MDDKIRIGVIGCSTIAKNSTIPAILKSANYKLAFVGSRSNDKAKKIAQEFGCEKYGSYEDVLDDNSVDAVYIRSCGSSPKGSGRTRQTRLLQAGLRVERQLRSTR